ncbi:MAG: hypothetical protein ACFB9M_03575 [Myxococcota bacterium]
MSRPRIEPPLVLHEEPKALEGVTHGDGEHDVEADGVEHRHRCADGGNKSEAQIDADSRTEVVAHAHSEARGPAAERGSGPTRLVGFDADDVVRCNRQL